MKTVSVGLNLATAITAFAAAVFWFLSVRGKVPQMVSYWDGTPPEDPFYRAFVVSVKMNKWAAGFSGVSAILFGLSLAIQASVQR
jgi:hypothetical protein